MNEERLTIQQRLARVWTASGACNLRGVLRSFTADADELWTHPETLSELERSLLIVWADIIQNILQHPAQDSERTSRAYGHALEASQKTD